MIDHIDRDHFDRNGNPISPWTWEILANHPSYRFVAHDLAVSTAVVGQGFRVVTVWMGFDPDAPLWPLHPVTENLFETVVLHCRQLFTVKDDATATEADARRQHDASVAWAAARLSVPTVIRIPVVPARPRAGWVKTTRRREFGFCAACYRRQELTVAGMVGAHGTSAGGEYATCLGTRLPPATRRQSTSRELVKR